MTSIYFRVNNKIIFNQVLARYESFVSKKPIEFVCHDELDDQMNWLQEPAESLDQLMDRHAFNLRNKYEKLVLLWSGGTDSHTIYNVFKRNNIHIDEIIFFAGDQFEPWLTDRYMDWLRENHSDPLTKITVKHRFDPASKQQIVTGEDWIFQNITMIPKIVSGICDPVMWEYCAEQYSGSTWCLITGHEQPRVFSKNNKYYACQNSVFFIPCMGFQNIECFYTEPQLALKQSHMIKRMLKLRINANVSNINLDPDGKKFKDSSNATYVAWQRALGRHIEVLPGMSWSHKGIERKFESLPVNPLNMDGELSRGYDLALDLLLKKDDDMAKTFVQGIKNLLLEKDFYNHLVETSASPVNNIIGKHAGAPIYSKPFCIGE
jgi:hypothetical protein